MSPLDLSHAELLALTLASSLTNHTGFFTYTPSAVSFHPLQQFWTDDDLQTALAQLQTEIAQANVSTFISKQYQLQIDSIKQGQLAQMELVFLAGQNHPFSVHVICSSMILRQGFSAKLLQIRRTL